MWRSCRIVGLAVLGCALLGPGPISSQEDKPSPRKVVDRVQPAYPELARRMNLQGIVRVEVVIASNGTARVVAVKGGNPVLADAAVTAVRKWRWEPAARETRQLVEVKFEPRR